MINIGIIVAAGKQSRFSTDVPKALSVVDNEILAVRNFNILQKYCNKVYVVVSSSNKKYFEEYFNEGNLLDIGESGKGSGDAIYESLLKLKRWHFRSILVCWGDTVLDESVVEISCNEYKDNLNVFIPVVEEEKPYVQFLEVGSSHKVLFSKYGDTTSKGYHDLSIFVSDFNYLFDNLLSYRNKFYNKGAQKYDTRSGEFEFLEIFNETATFKLIKLDVEDMSFNTIDELNNIKNKIERKK